MSAEDINFEPEFLKKKSAIVKTKLLKIFNKFDLMSTSCSWCGCCVFHVTGHGPLMYNVHPFPFIYSALPLCFPCYRAWSLNLLSYQKVLALQLYLTIDIWVTPTTDRQTQPWFNMAEKCSKHRICTSCSLKTVVCII